MLVSDTKATIQNDEITNIVSASVSNDNIVINKANITDKITYIDYKYENTDIGLLAVKDSTGDVKVVVNTCQSCNGSPNAYFLQVGDSIECQNCKNQFKIDYLDYLVDYGCNPLAITIIIKEEEKIYIPLNQIEELKEKFNNWNGQKLN